MSEILHVARRELASFFGSPVAYLFIGAFLAATLFTFFWAETFFARNIADARPLFDWMPILLIFLVAALTMRLWSEERRAGTLETLLTLPVSPAQAGARQIPRGPGPGGGGPGPDPAPAGHRVPARAPGLGPGDRRLPGDPAVGGGLCGHRGLRLRPHRQPHRQPDRHDAGLRGLLPHRLGGHRGAPGAPGGGAAPPGGQRVALRVHRPRGHRPA